MKILFKKPFEASLYILNTSCSDVLGRHGTIREFKAIFRKELKS